MGRIKQRNNHLRETLGLTQEELAILFKIPISRIAMYETNQRDLPFEVSMSMTQMFMHLLEKRKQEFTHPILKSENQKMNKLLQDELQKNETLRRKYQMKLEELMAKYEKAMANFYLADYYETKVEQDDKSRSNSDSSFLSNLAQIKLQQSGLTTQFQLKLQLETLKFQQQYLQEELKKAKSVTASE